ncbi:hypothetical protein N9W34_07080 [Rickettsiales bacterium]|nr:hypothetical protein [Rickettsiales bacterium]
MVHSSMDEIMKKYILALLVIMATGCQNPQLNIATMPKAPEYGPPEYIAGWKAGCQTGMTTYSNSYYRNRYKTNVDGHMMQNPYYNKGWELGQRYCSYYSSTYLANTEMASLSNDRYTKSDLRADNSWFQLESDGWFSYEGMDTLTNW